MLHLEWEPRRIVFVFIQNAMRWNHDLSVSCFGPKYNVIEISNLNYRGQIYRIRIGVCTGEVIR